jgi:hypothetical protein
MIVRDSISGVLAYKVINTGTQVYEAMTEGAREIETYAQSNAPWEDQTGAARAGLSADVGMDGLNVVISLSHSVDYGVYLELKDNGKYAIIMPTLEALGPKILRDAGAVVVTR